jgi:hypothetical protein
MSTTRSESTIDSLQIQAAAGTNELAAAGEPRQRLIHCGAASEM